MLRITLDTGTDSTIVDILSPDIERILFLIKNHSIFFFEYNKLMRKENIFEKNNSYYKEIFGIFIFVIILRLLFALGAREGYAGVTEDVINFFFQNYSSLAAVFMGIVFSKYDLLISQFS